MTNRFGGFAFICLSGPSCHSHFPVWNAQLSEPPPAFSSETFCMLGRDITLTYVCTTAVQLPCVQWIHPGCNSSIRQCKSWASQKQVLHFPVSQMFRCPPVSVPFPGMPTSGWLVCSDCSLLLCLPWCFWSAFFWIQCFLRCVFFKWSLLLSGQLVGINTVFLVLFVYKRVLALCWRPWEMAVTEVKNIVMCKLFELGLTV